ASLRPSLPSHQPRPAHLEQDVLEVLGRHVLLLGELAHGGRASARGGELGRGPQGVVDTSGYAHTSIIPSVRRGWSADRRVRRERRGDVPVRLLRINCQET